MEVATLVGFILGVAASFVAWRITLFVYAPRLKLSPRISVIQSRGREIYRFKFLNESRRAPIFDITINIALLLRGLEESRPTNRRVIRVRTGEAEPTLGQRTKAWRKSNELVRDPAARIFRVPQVKLNDPQQLLLTEPCRARYLVGELGLPDFLELGNRSYLRIVVTASHGISGRRKAFTRYYTRSDLIQKEFGDRDSVELES